MFTKECILLNCSIEEFKDVMQSLIDDAIKKITPLTQNVDNDVMTREGALKFLQCSSPTLIKFQKEGLPYHRLGKKVYFKKSEILSFTKTSK